MAIIRTAAIGAALACLNIAGAFQKDNEPIVRKRSMAEQDLVYKVDAEYPAAALQRRIQGTVRFEATIGKDGRVEQSRLISGHPLLIRAARQAVKQWIYRPTMLGGQPVRVITQVEVSFNSTLTGSP